jgi:poly(ADP-ribose) glycohydrolase
MIGAERYSKYSGYADSFKWQGNFHDRTPRDAWGRRFTEVVAMDALRYTAASKQYSLKCIKRELNKAFVAFTRPEAAKENLSAIATGNWGCGAFGGGGSHD